MTDRIKTILKSLNLSPSQFADKIDVQRSSVSHILSGRNKPSLDFVTKILHCYPEINPQWLLLGKGSMLANPDLAVQTQTERTSASLKKEILKSQVSESTSMKELNSPIPVKDIESRTDNQEIKEIIIFYKNNTFKAYKPS